MPLGTGTGMGHRGFLCFFSICGLVRESWDEFLIEIKPTCRFAACSYDALCRVISDGNTYL